MNEHLLRFNKTAKFCIFDFETEGLNLFSSRPWQFSCVVGTQNEILREHNLFIKWPDLNMSKDAAIITRFNQQQVNSLGKDPKEVLTIINQEFESADWIGGHNILGYDIHLYRRYCERMGVKPIEIERKLIDTMACGKGIKLEIPYKPGEDFLIYQIRLVNEIVAKKGFATLLTFAKKYDIKLDETKLHDALYDVRVNFEVLKRMLWEIEI